jgi:hypothetical protein
MKFNSEVLEDGFNGRKLEMSVMRAGFVPLKDKINILFVFDETTENQELFYDAISELALKYFETEIIVASTGEVLQSEKISKDNVYIIENIKDDEMSWLFTQSSFILSDSSSFATFPQKIIDLTLQIKGQTNRHICDTMISLLDAKGAESSDAQSLFDMAKAKADITKN